MRWLQELLLWFNKLFAKECHHPESDKTLITLQAAVTVETLAIKCGRCGYMSEPFTET